MAAFIRTIILFTIVVFALHQMPQIKQLEFFVEDQFDERPVVNILFIGNSRTFFNDMPVMIKSIANSAHSEKNYKITMHAKPSLTLADHWNSPDVQELLRQKWDYVVLQGASAEQVNDENNERFLTYGQKLIELIKENGATPVLFVMWRYADGDPMYENLPALKPVHYRLIQESYTQLARVTGTQMVNVGKVWEELLTNAPQIPLYEDTNHPSIYGSYLCALMFYQFFSGDDLSHVTYAPLTIFSDKDVELLKNAAQSW